VKSIPLPVLRSTDPDSTFSGRFIQQLSDMV
jgi:hypothetical protein